MKENEAIEVLKCFDKQVVVKSNSAYHTCEGIDACNLAVAALEEKKNNRWTPCSERLPDKELKEAKALSGRETVYPVMATVKKRKMSGDYINVTDKVFYGELYGSKKFFDKDENGINVVAWKPLPEPYKGE